MKHLCPTPTRNMLLGRNVWDVIKTAMQKADCFRGMMPEAIDSIQACVDFEFLGDAAEFDAKDAPGTLRDLVDMWRNRAAALRHSDTGSVSGFMLTDAKQYDDRANELEYALGKANL